MLTSWRLTNFKSFKGATWLSFAPLTFICGANSSGKSSVIQSILLIKQTVQHAPSIRPIALNGPLVRLGTFSDIENFHSSKESRDHFVGIGWEIGQREIQHSPSDEFAIIQETVKSASIDFHFDTNSNKKDKEILEIHPSLRWARVAAQYQDVDNESHELKVSIRRAGKRERKIRFNTSQFGEAANPFAFIVQEIDVACTRFRRHRVRCFNGTGGWSWRDGSSRESSSLKLYA